MDEAAILADHVEGTVDRAYLDEALREALRRQSYELEARLRATMDERFERAQHQMASAWRKDLLLVSIAQFFALAVAVGSLAAFG